MTEATIKIDWITATIAPRKARPGPGAAAAIAHKLGQHELGPAKPFPNNYTQAVAIDYGRLSWHEDRPQLKICYNATGQDCTRMYTGGSLASDIVGRLYDLEANITRLDVALDCYIEADLGDLVSAFQADPTWTTVRTCRPFQQITAQGQDVQARWSGVYLGSQSSHRYLCVYDKRLERGQDGQPWIRIELRTRHEYAAILAAEIARHGVEMPTRGQINAVARPPVDWWAAALDGPATEAPPIGRPKSDQDRWLLEDILPILEARLQAAQGLQDPVYKAYKAALLDAQEVLIKREHARQGNQVAKPVIGAYAFKRK